jgi:hypothetical protein
MQQTRVVSGISLAQADHDPASGERRSNAEPDSTRSRSLIETTTSPHLASGHLTPVSLSSSLPPTSGCAPRSGASPEATAGQARLPVLMLCPTAAQQEIRLIAIEGVVGV